MLVNITKDEMYPVYIVDNKVDKNYGRNVNLPEEVIYNYTKAYRDFCEALSILEDILEEKRKNG